MLGHHPVSQRVLDSQGTEIRVARSSPSTSYTCEGDLFMIDHRPYLTVRTEKVRMVNQDEMEDSGHSTKLGTVNKKHCHYYLFDRLQQTLKNSAAVQEYLILILFLIGTRW